MIEVRPFDEHTEIDVKVRIENAKGIKMPDLFDHLEKSLLIAALRASSGLKAQAGRLLGINRTTLVMKMKKHDLPLLEPVKRKARANASSRT